MKMKGIYAVIEEIDDSVEMRSKKPSYRHEILGREIREYVRKALEGAGIPVITADSEDFNKAAVGSLLVINANLPRVTASDIKEFIEFHKNSGAIRSECEEGTAVIMEDGLVMLSGGKEDVNKELKCDNMYSKCGLGFAPVTSLKEISEAYSEIARGICEKHAENGVLIIDPSSTYIAPGVEIGKDTVIYPNVFILGETKIGEDCHIGSGSQLFDMIVGDGVNIENSVLKKSKIGCGTTVGPFAYVRPGCDIGEKVKIGDFVEVKNSKIGNNTKASHLTYLGDSDIGENIIFGCGVVTVNYDGANKYRTTVEDNAFVGCNTNLIAPVKVGEGAFVAAGSTITEDVPGKNLAVARARQINKPDWKLNS